MVDSLRRIESEEKLGPRIVLQSSNPISDVLEDDEKERSSVIESIEVSLSNNVRFDPIG